LFLLTSDTKKGLNVMELHQAICNQNNKKPLMYGLNITKRELEKLFYIAMTNITVKIIRLEANGTKCPVLWGEYRELNTIYKLLKL